MGLMSAGGYFKKRDNKFNKKNNILDKSPALSKNGLIDKSPALTLNRDRSPMTRGASAGLGGGL